MTKGTFSIVSIPRIAHNVFCCVPLSHYLRIVIFKTWLSGITFDIFNILSVVIIIGNHLTTVTRRRKECFSTLRQQHLNTR